MLLDFIIILFLLSVIYISYEFYVIDSYNKYEVLVTTFFPYL